MTPPAVAVILPIAGPATLVRRSVLSVTAQTISNIEIVLIARDGASAALSAAVEFAARDPRISIVAMPGRSAAAARNLGVELTSAPLIAFMEPGDVWVPTKLASHCALHAAHPAIGISYARVAHAVSGPGPLVVRQALSTVPLAPLDAATLARTNPAVTVSNIVTTRAACARIGDFDTTLGSADDQEWLHRAALGGHIILGISETLVDHFEPTEKREMPRPKPRAAQPDAIDVAAAEMLAARYPEARTGFRSHAAPTQLAA